jgi:hypothetical protein
VIAALVKGGVLKDQEVQKILQTARQHCLKEMENPPDECDKVFARFVKRYAAGTSG